MIVGKVQATSSKPTSYGTMYNIKVENEWYGCGKDNPGCSEGDLVQFKMVQKGNFKNVQGNVTVLEKATASAPQQQTQQQGGSTFKDTRQHHIEMQSSRAVAASLVALMLEHDPALPRDPEAIIALHEDTSWKLFDSMYTLDEEIAARYEQ